MRINDESGKIYVLDRNKIDAFDKKGIFIKSIYVGNIPHDFFIGTNEHIYASLWLTSETGLYTSFCKINNQGEILKKFGEFPWKIYTEKLGNGLGVVSTDYEYELYISRIDYQSYIYGYSKEYELNVTDIDGHFLFKIKKDARPAKFSQEEKNKYILSEYKPFFYLILTDNKKRIYVQTNKTWAEEQTIEKEIDIFSKDGHYIYRTTLPRNTYVIKNGFLYALVIDEDEGIELVKRYRIQTWEQIKKGI